MTAASRLRYGSEYTEAQEQEMPVIMAQQWLWKQELPATSLDSEGKEITFVSPSRNQPT
jgi:hypothetical protein